MEVRDAVAGDDKRAEVALSAHPGRVGYQQMDVFPRCYGDS